MEGTNNYGFEIEDEFDILQDTPPGVKVTEIKSDDTEIPELGFDLLDDGPQDKKPAEAVKTDVALTEGDNEPDNADDQNDTSDPTEDEDDTFQTISENLLKMGVFTLNEGEEKIDLKKPEEFAERWQIEKQKGAVEMVNNIVGQYGEDYRDAFDKIFNKGLNPYEYFTRQAQIDSYEAVELEDNIEAQKSMYRAMLKVQNPDITPEKVEAKLAKVIDFEALEEESKDAQAYLVKQEKKALEAAAVAEQQTRYAEYQRQEQFGESVYNILSDKLKTGDFDGIPVTKKQAESAFDFLYTRKQYTDGSIATEAEQWFANMMRPENHAMAAKFALMARNNFDTSKIQKKATSSSTNELFNNLKRKEKVDNRTQKAAPAQDPNTIWGF